MGNSIGWGVQYNFVFFLSFSGFVFLLQEPKSLAESCGVGGSRMAGGGGWQRDEVTTNQALNEGGPPGTRGTPFQVVDELPRAGASFPQGRKIVQRPPGSTFKDETQRSVDEGDFFQPKKTHLTQVDPKEWASH